MNEAIRIGGVCERDMDLFLQEQLMSSPGFCRWFVGEKLGLAGVSGVAESVERGQTDRTRESDVTARFGLSDGTRLTVFVENKIKASFQNSQYERYKSSAERSLRNGEMDDYRIVLFAPRRYLESRSLAGFDASECIKLAYDDVLVFLKEAGVDSTLSLVDRARYKTALVREAIAVASGKDDSVYEEFWTRYSKEVNKIVREFNFSCPKGRNSPGDDTIEFKQSGLCTYDWPIKPVPVHRLAEGNFGHFGKSQYGEFYIMLPKSSQSDRFSALEQAFKPLLQPHMMIVKAKGSAAIRIAVPPLKRATWTRDQVPALRSALVSGKALYNWFLSSPVQEAWLRLMEEH